MSGNCGDMVCSGSEQKVNLYKISTLTRFYNYANAQQAKSFRKASIYLPES